MFATHTEWNYRVIFRFNPVTRLTTLKIALFSRTNFCVMGQLSNSPLIDIGRVNHKYYADYKKKVRVSLSLFFILAYLYPSLTIDTACQNSEALQIWHSSQSWPGVRTKSRFLLWYEVNITHNSGESTDIRVTCLLVHRVDGESKAGAQLEAVVRKTVTSALSLGWVDRRRMCVQLSDDVDDWSCTQNYNGVRLECTDDKIRITVAVDVHTRRNRVPERHERTRQRQLGRRQIAGGYPLRELVPDAGGRTTKDVDGAWPFERRADY